jgi:hypothetical protein
MPMDGKKEEASDAIRNLSSVDHVKLMLIARFFIRSRHISSVEAEDLLHDAIVKTMDGQRRWKKGISIIKHLDRTMESDSGHIADHESKFKEIPYSENEDEPHNLFADNSDHIDAIIEIDKIFSFFKNDAVAFKLLALRLQGLLASDIQHIMRIGKTQYETITKRIRRKFLQLIPFGGKRL